MGRKKSSVPTRRTTDSNDDAGAGEDILAGAKRQLIPLMTPPQLASVEASLSDRSSESESEEDSGDDEGDDVVPLAPPAKRIRRSAAAYAAERNHAVLDCRDNGGGGDSQSCGNSGDGAAVEIGFVAEPQRFVVSDADSEEACVPRRPKGFGGAVTTKVSSESEGTGGIKNIGDESLQRKHGTGSGRDRGRRDHRRNAHKAVNSFLRALGSSF
jgi:hypothetical protein